MEFYRLDQKSPAEAQPTAIMSEMKAIAVTEFGKPAQLIQRPVPKPGAGEVLLKTVTVGCKIRCISKTANC